MGNTCGNTCTGSPKEEELKLEKPNTVVEEKTTRNVDLEEKFRLMLEQIEYPNNSVKVLSFR